MPKPRPVSLWMPTALKTVVLAAAEHNGLSLESEVMNVLAIAHGLGEQLNPHRHRRRLAKVRPDLDQHLTFLPLPLVLYEVVANAAKAGSRTLSAQIRHTLWGFYGEGEGAYVRTRD